MRVAYLLAAAAVPRDLRSTLRKRLLRVIHSTAARRWHRCGDRHRHWSDGDDRARGRWRRLRRRRCIACDGAPAACCSNRCGQQGVCVAAATACGANATACTTGSSCCSATCSAGTCQANATCEAAGATCAHGIDCCGGTCTGGICQSIVGVTPAGGGNVCISPGAVCTSDAACCSGRCEPVTGQAGVLHCTDACKRRRRCLHHRRRIAVDLGCFGGVAATRAKECTEEGGACKANAECCSDICGADGRCTIDAANSRCRPTGENCSSGPQSGCCFATNNNDLCDKETQRCEAPPGQCHGNQAVCAADGDCCSGHCGTDKKCFTQCVATAGVCKTGLDQAAAVAAPTARCDAPLPSGRWRHDHRHRRRWRPGHRRWRSRRCSDRHAVHHQHPMRQRLRLAGFCDNPPIVK